MPNGARWRPWPERFGQALGGQPRDPGSEAAGDGAGPRRRQKQALYPLPESGLVWSFLGSGPAGVVPGSGSASRWQMEDRPRRQAAAVRRRDRGEPRSISRATTREVVAARAGAHAARQRDDDQGRNGVGELSFPVLRIALAASGVAAAALAATLSAMDPPHGAPALAVVCRIDVIACAPDSRSARFPLAARTPRRPNIGKTGAAVAARLKTVAGDLLAHAQSYAQLLAGKTSAVGSHAAPVVPDGLR